MKRVFISHPFADDPIGNKVKVDSICKNVDDNTIPISPLHLFSFMENDNSREEIIKICYQLIDICDEVWVYGESSGCKHEINYARSTGKHVEVKY